MLGEREVAVTFCGFSRVESLTADIDADIPCLHESCQCTYWTCSPWDWENGTKRSFWFGECVKHLYVPSGTPLGLIHPILADWSPAGITVVILHSHSHDGVAFSWCSICSEQDTQTSEGSFPAFQSYSKSHFSELQEIWSIFARPLSAVNIYFRALYNFPFA